MICKVGVTFEYPVRKPQTVDLGPYKAGKLHTIAHRAVEQAQAELRPIGWSSVVVLIQRDGPLEPGDDGNLDSGETEPAEGE